MKKVLIVCTGNSCRSIMAEALINRCSSFKGVKAFSAGSEPAARVNPKAMDVLAEYGIWSDSYHSKSLDEVLAESPFDLVVTVCDKAAKNCPIIPKARKRMHIPFDDPDGKERHAFKEVLLEIKNRLIPFIERELLK